MTTMMKLVEECSGTGELLQNGQTVRPIAYRVRRFQGMTEGSGMPIPAFFASKAPFRWILPNGLEPPWD
jgi:hypothetical protein